MTVKEIKEWIKKEMVKAYEDMGNFVNDDNPQVKELYNRCRGEYDALDNLHYKLYGKYFSI